MIDIKKLDGLYQQHLADHIPDDTKMMREWVGLTEDEKAEIRGSVKYSQYMSALEYGILVQDATEAKLKTKNAYGWQSVENPTEYLDNLRGGTDLCGND